jgi:hypothetical protein
MGRDNFVAPTASGSRRPPIPDILGATLAKDQDTGESMEIKSTLAWDYEQLGSNAGAAIEHTVAIKKSERRASEAIITAGEHLIAMKDMLNHGQWGDWLRTEFSLGQDTAQNMINVAREFGGKIGKFPNLKPSVLYMLAEPSTPQAAREVVIEQAAAGNRVTVADAKAVIDSYKPAREQIAATAEVAAMLQHATDTARAGAAVLNTPRAASDDGYDVDRVSQPIVYTFEDVVRIGSDHIARGVAARKPEDEKIVHPLDCYDDEDDSDAAILGRLKWPMKMRDCHELKMWLKATRDEKAREFFKLTGQPAPAALGNILDAMIGTLEAAMDAVEREAVASVNH